VTCGVTLSTLYHPVKSFSGTDTIYANTSLPQVLQFNWNVINHDMIIANASIDPLKDSIIPGAKLLINILKIKLMGQKKGRRAKRDRDRKK